MVTASISREKSLIQKIILIDGVWGTGKSMLGPLIGSFNNVEKFMMLELFEHLCNLCALKKIEHNACINLLRLHADRSLFNSLISREVNLRINDHSGLFNNPHPFLYLKRLLLNYETEKITEQIKVKKPIMNIMVHNFLCMADYAFEAFGEKLKFIEVVRHPIYLVEHWYNYIDRCGTDPTEFDLWIDYKGHSLPWFSFGWEQKYIESKTIDKAIYSISKLLENGSLKYDNLTSKQKKNTTFIPFEGFVIEPFSYLNKLKLFLEEEYDQFLMKKSLKKQKCPRMYIHGEKGRLQYGFNRKHNKLTEKEDYQRRLNFIHEEASKEAVILIENLSSMYAKDHNFPKKMPWE